LGAEQASGALTIGKWYSITASQTNYFYTGSAIDDKFLATAATALNANNKVKEITLADMFATVACPTADVMWDVKIAALTAKTQAGLVVRLDSATTPTKCITCALDGSGNVKVREQTAATTWTTLITAVKAAAANDTLRLHVSGNAVRCYHVTNAGTVTLIGSATATANTNTNHGVMNTSAGSNTIALAQGFPVGTGGEYAALEAM